MESFDLHKRVKTLRRRKGLSQEALADKAGLSLRTIQRIENGETVPRGDSLQRLATAFEVSPDDIMDWQIREDKGIMMMLNLSQLGFLAFPLLGVIIPMAIWILKKDKVRYINETGKSILNFQISWVIALFVLYIIFAAVVILHFHIPLSFFGMIGVFAFLYVYNIVIVVINTFRSNSGRRIWFNPAITFLK